LSQPSLLLAKEIYRPIRCLGKTKGALPFHGSLASGGGTLHKRERKHVQHSIHPEIRSRRFCGRMPREDLDRMFRVAADMQAGVYLVPASQVADAILEEADKLVGALLS